MLLDWATQALAPLGLAPAEHHRAMLARLQDVADGRCDRLMLLLPPGSAKSTYASVVFPAWWLATRGRTSVVAACHTESLAASFGRRVRALLGEQDAPLAREERAAVRFATRTGGSYFATGVRGPLLGRRAELIVADDPIKSQAEADSALCRDQVWDWWRAELTTRLIPGGRMVLAMTRWHEDDLAARLLEGGEGWQALTLPALAEADDPLGRAPGAPLWPAWEDAAALERRRLAVGPRAWAAMYQQRPQGDAEALFRVDRIALLDEPPPGRAVRAWDLAATAAEAGRDPDWTVGLKLARTDAGGFCVLDVLRLRGGPAEVAAAIERTARLDGPGVPVGLPQDPGQAGKAQIGFLSERLAGFRVLASPESGSKLARAQPAAARVAAGEVTLLRGAWNRALLEELRAFPQGRKDDQVDALSRALTLLAEQPARMGRVDWLGR